MSSKKGFTLVELLIVITILGVLGSIGYSAFRGSQERARDSKRKTDLRQIAIALEIYRQSNSGNYSTTASAGCSCANSTKLYTDIAGFMSGDVPKDPSTQNHYCYYSENNGKSFRLFAKLENCSDPEVVNAATCATDTYNFSIASADLPIASAQLSTPLTCPL